MYNTVVYCTGVECLWGKAYDKNRDTVHGYKDYKVCPICGEVVINKPWSPSL